MARFAHFFIKYKHEFAPHHWEDRQRHLGSLFEEDSSIDFRLGEGETQKVFNHRVYHLLSAPEIIVMQFANSIDIPIEKHYEPSVARDEPSCFVVIDNRSGLRTVAIHRRKKAFGNPQQVARILSRTINARLFADYCYTIDILPSYYAEDLFKTWTRLQHHSQNLIFSAPEGLTESEILQRVDQLRGEGKEYFDDSLMSLVLPLALAAKRDNYKSLYTVMPEESKTALYVDKTSVFMKNLLTLSRATDTPVELITSDGAHYSCLIDSEETLSDKIVTREFDAVLLECLFHGTDKEGAPLEQVKRIELEAKVITMMNSIKHESEDEESRSLLGDSLVNRVN